MQITWQMLGLRRWLPRSAIGRTAVAQAPDRPDARTPQSQATGREIVQKTESASMIQVHHGALEPETLVSSVCATPADTQTRAPIALSCGSLFDFPEHSVLKAENSELVWFLPSLYPGENDYRLFRSLDEADLLASALDFVGLTAEAALFRNCAEVTVCEAPHFPHWRTCSEWMAPILQGKILVACGSVALHRAVKRFLDDNALAQAQMVECLHPALALASARGKYRLWVDVERIKGKQCTQ